jgi:ACS family tartrate transporter-like MFS transporter
MQRRVIRKVTIRLVPFLGLLYLTNYLDRVNLGFAALTMNGDLGLSAAAYGLGAGLFFIGYFFFEVPSNIILHRVGARVWIARIMVTWGLVASATAFIQGEISFYVVRVLLGVAEAGGGLSRWKQLSWRGGRRRLRLGFGSPGYGVVGC